MSERRIYHVTATEKGWEGKLIGSRFPSIVGKTKKEVVYLTVKLAKAQKLAQVRIHKRNGQIQEERTYPRWSDPRETKG